MDPFAGDGTNATLDGTGTAARFRYGSASPRGGIAISGNLAYMGTWGSIRKVNLTTAAVTTVAGHATETGCTDSSNPSLVRFGFMWDIATDGSYLYTTGDCGFSYPIRKTSIATGETTQLAYTGGGFKNLTLAPDGWIYATSGSSIIRVNPGTGATSTYVTLSGATNAITSDSANLWVVRSGSPNAIERVSLADPGDRSTFHASSGVGIGALTSVGEYLYGVGGTHRIRRYVKSDGSFASVAGVSIPGYENGTGTDAWLNTISGLGWYGSALWIVDQKNYRLRRAVETSPLDSAQSELATTTLGISLGAVTTFAGDGEPATEDGVGTEASLWSPESVTVEDGMVYVGTWGSIRVVDPDTKQVSRLAGSPTDIQNCSDSQDKDQVRFTGVADLESDGHYLYSLSSCGIGVSALRRTHLQSGATSSIATGGINGVTVGPGGTIYVITGNTIQKVDRVEGTMTFFASIPGSGHQITSDATHLWVSYVDTSPKIAKYALSDPVPVSFAGTGAVGISALESAGPYLYASSGPKFRLYAKATGEWIDVAGNDSSGYLDGVGIQARFSVISGIASDGTSLWIADKNNNRLRKVVQAQPQDLLFGACGTGDFVIAHCSLESDPVNTATGNFYREETDATLPGIGVSFAFTRHYNSLDPTTGPLGPGWTHTYLAALSFPPGGNVVFRAEDGKKITFVRQPNGSYYSGPGVHASLSAVTGGYALTTNAQVTWRFDTQGRLTSIKDRNAQGPILSYNGQGQLTTITDSVGRTVTLTYSGGLLTSLSLPGGRTVQYAYTGGKLTSVTDVRGNTTTYTYEAGGRLATVVDQSSHTVVENTYGATGRVATQRDPLGNLGTFAWDPATETSTYTDALGKAWTDDYDNGLLVREIDPLGNTTTYGYAGVDLTTITDPRGNTTRMTYDARGNLLTRTAPPPLSYQESFTYNSKNDLLTATDGRANTTTYQYDTPGNLTQITEPGTVVTQFGRDPGGTGLLTSITDPRGKTTALEYTSGNLTRITTPLGNVTTMAYDASGRMTSMVEPRGNVAGADPADYRWTYTYDAADHLRTKTDPLGNLTEWTYDPAGNLSGRIDAKGRTTTWGYNAANELTSVTAPGPTVTSYAYDQVGNLTSRTDAKNHLTTYGYDPARRLTSVTSPIGQVWTYESDAASNLTKVVTARGNATPDPTDGKVTYAYDAINRITGIDYSDSTPDVTFGYDATSNRTQMTDGVGTETFAWDALNRLTSVTRGPDSFSYLYDPADNVTRRTYPDGTVMDSTYDDDGRMASVTSGGATTTYGYDPAGNLLTTALPPANGHVETRTYDRAGRLVELKNAKGAQVLSRFTYTLDAVGNPTQVVTPTETTTYAYDARDRLTEVCYQASCPGDSDPFIRWAYDPVGNRTTETRPAGASAYAYNDADQLTSASGPGGTTTYTYDQDGNQTAAGGRTFAYDLANRMTSTASGSTTITYAYDGEGKRLEASSGPSAQDKTRYIWDPNHPLYQVALERDGASGLRRRYVHGSDLISMTTGGSDFYYHHDALGSVANLTSAAGAAQWSYSYEPFGTIRTQIDHTGSAPVNLMRFTGELFDDQTGLYHLRARQYDSGSGRFLAMDPLAPVLADPYVASYVYASNRPTVLIDPNGMRGCAKTGYQDLNVSGILFIFSVGYYKDACGERHWYGGVGLGSFSVSLTYAPKQKISCDSTGFQIFTPSTFGGSVGRGTSAGGEKGTFGEAGSGVPGLGFFRNWVIDCPGG